MKDVVHDVEGLDGHAAIRERDRRIAEVRADVEDGPLTNGRGEVGEQLVVLPGPEEPLASHERSERFEVYVGDVRSADVHPPTVDSSSLTVNRCSASSSRSWRTRGSVPSSGTRRGVAYGLRSIRRTISRRYAPQPANVNGRSIELVRTLPGAWLE